MDFCSPSNTNLSPPIFDRKLWLPTRKLLVCYMGPEWVKTTSSHPASITLQQAVRERGSSTTVRSRERMNWKSVNSVGALGLWGICLSFTAMQKVKPVDSSAEDPHTPPQWDLSISVLAGKVPGRVRALTPSISAKDR